MVYKKPLTDEARMMYLMMDWALNKQRELEDEANRYNQMYDEGFEQIQNLYHRREQTCKLLDKLVSSKSIKTQVAKQIQKEIYGEKSE